MRLERPSSAGSSSTGSALRLGGRLISSSASSSGGSATARSTRVSKSFGLAAEAIPENSAVASLMRRPDEVARLHEGYMARTRTLLRALGTGEGDPFALDLCFVFDGTGSMGGYIAAAKDTIHNIVSVYRKSFPKYALRVAYVAYRDFGDERPVETLNFTENAQEFAASLGAVAATGGADEAEDVLGGLEAALRLDWSARRRVLMHIADAPSHGTFYHDGAGDSHPSFDSDGANGRSLMQRLALKSIDFYFCKINGSTDKMVRKFAEAYDPAARKPLASLEMRSAAAELGAKTLDTVCSTLTASSLSIRSGKGSALEMDLAEYPLNKAPIVWSTAEHPRWGPWQTATRLAFPALASTAEIEGEALVSPKPVDEVRIRFSTEPCAKGSTRRVYFAITDAGERLVAKIWSVRGPSELIRELNVGGARCLAVARYFAGRFNPKLAHLGRKERLEFVDTFVCEAAVGTGRGRAWMTLEPFIEGAFTKYNSNEGFVLHGSAESELLQAFSHYTAERSHGRLLVVDLQGAGLARLTDPAVQFNPADVATLRPASASAFGAGSAAGTACGLSRIGSGLNRRVVKDGSVPYFSATDLGAMGFAKFLETHVCGPVCRALALSR
eukprot:tig00000076_g2427.t1